MALKNNRASRETAAPDDPLAARIRTLRLARGMTLRELADRAEVTEGFLSQVERGITSPSISTLRRIAGGLGQSIGSLFEGGAETGLLVRRRDRRVINYPGLRARDEFVSSAEAAKLQAILSVVEPGGGTGDEPYTHDSDEECLLVLEGTLDLWIGEAHYHLDEGDCIVYSSRVPHRNRNPGPGTARLLFILTPPSY